MRKFIPLFCYYFQMALQRRSIYIINAWLTKCIIQKLKNPHMHNTITFKVQLKKKKMYKSKHTEFSKIL